MPPPFPGMDPYLEHPGLWLGVHNRLIADLDDELGPQLRPRYFVAVEERVYIAELPDVVGRPDAVVVAVGGQPRPTNGPAPEVSRPVDRSDAQVLVAALPVVDRFRETYLEVRESATGDVVTSIEVLSPTNKLPGRGRREDEEKRAARAPAWWRSICCASESRCRRGCATRRPGLDRLVT